MFRLTIMPRHAKPASSESFDVDAARPVMDNAKHMHKAKSTKTRSHIDMGIHPSHQDVHHGKGVAHPGKSVSSGPQQASSLPGSLHILDPHGPSHAKGKAEGIPGIIRTTTEGAATRARLVGGIIESPMGGGKDASGPVHSVKGHDSTAYNAGFSHIAGSPFTSRHR